LEASESALRVALITCVASSAFSLSGISSFASPPTLAFEALVFNPLAAFDLDKVDPLMDTSRDFSVIDGEFSSKSSNSLRITVVEGVQVETDATAVLTLSAFNRHEAISKLCVCDSKAYLHISDCIPKNPITFEGKQNAAGGEFGVGTLARS
jgi:hypothetical protein